MSLLRRWLRRRDPPESRYRVHGARAGRGSRLVVQSTGPVTKARVGLSYPDGRPIPGFERQDSEPVSMNGVGEREVLGAAAADKQTTGTGFVSPQRQDL